MGGLPISDEKEKRKSGLESWENWEEGREGKLWWGCRNNNKNPDDVLCQLTIYSYIKHCITVLSITYFHEAREKRCRLILTI